MEYILTILLLVAFIVFAFLYIYSVFSSIKYGIPQVSSFESDRKVLRKNLDRSPLKGKKIIDMGSGTGKMLRFFEKEYGMKVFGVEIDLANCLIARSLNKIFSQNATITRGNYLNIDLKQYDYIYVYLFPEMIEKVETKIWSECSKGTIIFSNAFKFKIHKPKEIFLGEKGKEEIYVYEV